MKKRGCLTWIIGFLIICFMIPFYVLAWIPAIGFIIYYLVKRNFSGKRKRNFIISIIVFVTSLLWFIWAASNTVVLTGIHADWKSTKFDVSETTEVTITPVPSDATIRKLTLSDNDIAELDYEDGKATISFKKAGTAKLTFTANDSIDSNTTTITVTDKKAEEEAQKAKEEKERLAAEKAKKEEEEKAKKRKKKRLPKKKLIKRLKQKLMLKLKPLRKLKNKLKQTLLPNKLNKNGLPLNNKLLQPSNLKHLLMLLIQTLENSISLLAEM